MTQEAKRILIVEDEVYIREVYAEVLRDAGYTVIESGDGQDGLTKAKTGDWDLLFLDIMLPKKDGLEVLAELKKIEELKGKPIVLLTNLGRDSIIKEGMGLGAAHYLVKSEITPDKVLESVLKSLTPNAK